MNLVRVWNDEAPAWRGSETTATKCNHQQRRSFHLFQNNPNPFNPTTVISYQLPVVSQVDLSIYNLLGQKITTLVSEKQPVGTYKLEWDAGGLASGLYFYRLETDEGFIQTKKLILLK